MAQRHRERERQLIAERDGLQARYERLCRDNVQQAQPLRCKVRIDAGFCSSENVTELIESGYDVETKSANPALVKALRQQADAQPRLAGRRQKCRDEGLDTLSLTYLPVPPERRLAALSYAQGGCYMPC